MGRQHQQRRQQTREEQIAFLKAHGETDETIAALLALSEPDQKQTAAEGARVRPQPAPAAKGVYKIRNWSEYNKALVRRGSITLWFDDESIAGWWAEHNPDKLGAPYLYSDTAVLCALTLKEVFRLPLRQTEGFVGSLIELLSLELPVPNFSTLSRRAKTLDVPLGRKERDKPLHLVVDSTGLKVFGEGEWKVRQHGWVKRRTWRKLHLGVDESSGEIVCQVLTSKDVADSAMLRPLLEQVDDVLAQVTTDGAYDTTDCYGAIVARGALAVIPPNADAKDWGSHGARDQTVRRVNEIGRKAWKEESDYHRRSLAETAMFRMKTIFGPRLAARTEERQQTEAAVRCRALNRMTSLGMPSSYLFQSKMV
jgi:Transposase DDE domain